MTRGARARGRQPQEWSALTGGGWHRLLLLLLPAVPADERARASSVCRAWRDAARAPEVWQVLDLSHCSVKVARAALEALCDAPSWAALVRSLRLPRSLDLQAVELAQLARRLPLLQECAVTVVQLLATQPSGRFTETTRSGSPAGEDACRLVDASLADVPGPLRLKLEHVDKDAADAAIALAKGGRVDELEFADTNVFAPWFDGAAERLAAIVATSTPLTRLSLSQTGIARGGERVCEGGGKRGSAGRRPGLDSKCMPGPAGARAAGAAAAAAAGRARLVRARGRAGGDGGLAAREAACVWGEERSA